MLQDEHTGLSELSIGHFGMQASRTGDVTWKKLNLNRIPDGTHSWKPEFLTLNESLNPKTPKP